MATFTNQTDSTDASTQINGGNAYWATSVSPNQSAQRLTIPSANKYFDRNIIITVNGMASTAGITPNTTYYTSTDTGFGKIGAGYLSDTSYIKAGGDTLYASSTNATTNCIQVSAYENVAGWITSGTKTVYGVAPKLLGTVSALNLNGGNITSVYGTGTISTLGTSDTQGLLTIGANGYSADSKGVITVSSNTNGTVNIWGTTGDKTVQVVGHTVTADGVTVTDANGDLITVSPVFDGGSISGGVESITGSSVTISDTDTYNTAISVSASAVAKKDAILYNGAKKGWIDIADNATALAGDTTSTAIDGKTGYITALTIASGKTFGNSTTDAITIAGTAYELISGTEYARTTGTTNVTFPTEGSGTVTIAGKKVADDGALITQTPVFDGGTITGSVTDITNSNITTSTEDTYKTGISVTALASAQKSAILYNGDVDAWVQKADNTEALAADSSKTSIDSRTEYVTSMTIASGKTFGSSSTNAITIAGTAYEAVSGTEYASTSGTVDITFPTTGSGTVVIGGTTVATGGSLVAGTIVAATEAQCVAAGTTLSDGTKASSKGTYADYTVISNGVTVASNGYLVIPHGWYTDSKISLASIVPDVANIPYSTESPFILAGKTAYDIDGKLITGSIATYTGDYDLTTL